jgi:uncharacterized membrane protein
MALLPGALRGPHAFGRLALAILFIGAGAMHFIAPRPYVAIVPRWLPDAAMLVIISGICEIAGGVGLLVPPLRQASGFGLIALLIAVFPANIQMLLDSRAHGEAPWMQAVLWLRLPLQPLLAAWLWRVMR